MKNNILIFSYLISCLSLSACSPESASLKAERPLYDNRINPPPNVPTEPQRFQWITEDGGQSQLDFNPAVDILFVTDNSDSMKSAQENLSRNIDRFTAGIVRNKMIDYHIGVISVWDSERYKQKKSDSYEIGELRFIKNSKGNSYNRRFITKAERQYLASTLNIGVAPLEKGGPENEEVFSALSAALEKTGRGATNEEFFRPNAQLVVIVLTDADDSTSSINAEEMANKLFDFKNGKHDKVSVYGVLVRADDPEKSKDFSLRIHPKYHKTCFDEVKNGFKNNGTCTGFGPTKLEEFIMHANVKSGTPAEINKKHVMSIVDQNFGDRLGKIGADITVKTLEKDIFLTQRPRLDKNGKFMIRVRYGKQVIPESVKGGWLYNNDDNSIHLSGDIVYQYSEGARFSVDYVPLPLNP